MIVCRSPEIPSRRVGSEENREGERHGQEASLSLIRLTFPYYPHPRSTTGPKGENEGRTVRRRGDEKWCGLRCLSTSIILAADQREVDLRRIEGKERETPYAP